MAVVVRAGKSWTGEVWLSWMGTDRTGKARLSWRGEVWRRPEGYGCPGTERSGSAGRGCRGVDRIGRVWFGEAVKDWHGMEG